MAILCLTDFGILVFACLNEYIEQTFSFSLRSASTFTCKLIYYMCYLFSSFGAYLYAYIAMDRWYAVTRPIQYKQQHVTRAQTQLLTLFIFCFFICLPFFYFPSLVTSTTVENHKCQFEVHLFSVLTLLDGIFFSLVPFIFTCFFSFMTLVSLIRNNQREANLKREANLLKKDKFDNKLSDIG